jgi:hypothetical protein
MQKGAALKANSNARVEQHPAAQCAMMRRTRATAAIAVTNPKSD